MKRITPELTKQGRAPCIEHSNSLPHLCQPG